MAVRFRKCGKLPRNAQGFASQVNEHKRLVRVVAELLGKGQKDVQVKQKVLEQMLEMAYQKAPITGKKQDERGKLTWNLPR
jgi:hypothetical protein